MFTSTRFVFIAFCLMVLAGCEQPSLLSRIQAEQKLIVATGNSPITVFEGQDGYSGMEHDLVTGFAKSLGLEVEYRFYHSLKDLLEAVRTGQVHMAAAGLTVTEERSESLAFAMPYQQIRQQLVYRAGRHKPKDLAEIKPEQLEVLAASSHEANLEQLSQTDYPNLKWSSTTDLSSEDLLYLVSQDVLNYTIADSNQVALNQRYYANLKVAFDVSEPESLAWAFPKFPDTSLLEEADQYLENLKQSGELDQLLERYYGYVNRLNFVDKTTFWKHVKDRLPKFETWFKEAAEEQKLDWHLLAAVGYQESHWNPKAVSPTGVRGLMMLTKATAKRLKIKNRRDPKQSIFGGARYLRIMEESIPDRIPEPDRLWLALAGYNVGFGHLEDARVLTQRQGGNPDRWVEVKQRLPLLSQRKYYKTLKHGYARGREPVRYVDNIRNYYDLLVWQEQKAYAESAGQSAIDSRSNVK